MRTLLILSSVLVGLGTVMAHVADRMMSAPPPSSPTIVAKAAVGDSPAAPRSVTIPPDSRGHFQVDARIEGQRIGFMVDTGASVMALNERSAARFGLRPVPSDYRLKVSTANGIINAARAKIPMVDVGGLIVRDVEAMILPDEALGENLLGLSFLSRLRRFEYANGRMVLEQ